MPDPDPHRFVKLVTTTPIAAGVLAARLGSDGIVCDVRGPSSSYPFGPAHVYVLEGDLAEAREVLAIIDDDDGANPPAGRSAPRPPIIIFGALLIVVVLVGISIARVLVLGP